MSQQDERVKNLHQILRIVLAAKTPLRAVEIFPKMKSRKPIHNHSRSRYLAQLVKMDLIERQGNDGGSTYYVLPEQKELANSLALDPSAFTSYIYSDKFKGIYDKKAPEPPQLTIADLPAILDEPPISFEPPATDGGMRTLLEGCLKLSYALMEVTQALGSKVDGINERLDRIERLWK